MVKKKKVRETLTVTIPLEVPDLERLKSEMKKLCAEDVGMARSVGAAHILYGLDVLIYYGTKLGHEHVAKTPKIRGGTIR